MGTKTAKTEAANGEPQVELPGGNGQAAADAEGKSGSKKTKFSEAVQSWLPYCGRPVSVHLRFQLLMMDWAGDVIDFPIDDQGHMVPLGIATPALFRDVESKQHERGPMVTDTLERVFMQPAPCGKRLILLHKTEPKLGLSGAAIGYVVHPRDINSVSFVDRMPETIARPRGSGIITPSS